MRTVLLTLPDEAAEQALEHFLNLHPGIEPSRTPHRTVR
jgi:hypothetical protein